MLRLALPRRYTPHEDRQNKFKGRLTNLQPVLNPDTKPQAKQSSDHDVYLADSSSHENFAC